MDEITRLQSFNERIEAVKAELEELRSLARTSEIYLSREGYSFVLSNFTTAKNALNNIKAEVDSEIRREQVRIGVA